VATRSSAAPSATPKPAAPRSGKAGHHGTLHHSHHVATKHAEPKPKAAPKPKQHGPGKASHGGKGHGRA
jgi:hypothetical protein